MADIKPIILSMTPWDASKEYQMKFTYSGGLPVSNRLIITDNISGAQVYDKTETTSHFYHTIPANPASSTLTNGRSYQARIIVTDNNGIVSPVSDNVLFRCLSTPMFDLIEPTTERINKSSVDMFIRYYQEQQEPLYSYQQKLYNYSQQVIATSEMQYNKTGNIEYYINYTFYGLEDKTHYFVQSEGVTKEGIPVKTEMKHIFVDLDHVETTDVLNTYSDEYATVTGRAHLIPINADENSDDYTYIGDQVDLLEQEIHYNNDFEIVGDFTCSLKARMTHGDKRLLKLNRKNSSGYIELSSFIYDNSSVGQDEKVVYRLRVNNGMTDYNLFSDPMNVSDNDAVLIHIRRINNIYKLVVLKL